MYAIHWINPFSTFSVFDVFAADAIWKHCGKRRNCSLWFNIIHWCDLYLKRFSICLRRYLQRHLMLICYMWNKVKLRRTTISRTGFFFFVFGNTSRDSCLLSVVALVNGEIKHTFQSFSRWRDRIHTGTVGRIPKTVHSRWNHSVELCKQQYRHHTSGTDQRLMDRIHNQ